MIDGNEADDKIIAVLESDLAYGRILEIRDVPQGLIDRLKHYFLSYKQLPSDAEKKVEIVDVYDRVEAQDVITRSLRDYEDEFAAGIHAAPKQVSLKCRSGGKQAPATVPHQPTSPVRDLAAAGRR